MCLKSKAMSLPQVNDAAQPNTKLKSKLLFALRQRGARGRVRFQSIGSVAQYKLCSDIIRLCLLGQNKLKVSCDCLELWAVGLAVCVREDEQPDTVNANTNTNCPETGSIM